MEPNVQIESCSCKTCPNAAVVSELKRSNEMLHTELNIQKKQLLELKSAIVEIQSGITNKFGHERQFIFGKVSEFGKHFESRLKDQKKEILHEVDVKVDELTNKIDDKLLDQTDDLKDLEEDTELKIEELTLKAKAEALLAIKMKMGPYANKFAQLENTDASHGQLLHRMIHEKVNREILSAYVSYMRPGAVKWKNSENNKMNVLMVCYSLENHQLISFMESYCDDEFVKKHEWMKAMGRYIKLCMKLKYTDSSHGKLLHRMIQDNVNERVLSAYMSHMRPGAIKWRNHANNSLNALQVAYSTLDDELISLMESYCDEDMLSRYSDDKAEYIREVDTVGLYLHELVESTTRKPNVNAQGILLHKALMNQASNDVIRIVMEKMSAEVMNYESSEDSLNALQVGYSKLDDELISLMESYCDEDMLSRHSDDKVQYVRETGILGSYLPELLEATTRKPNFNDQGRLLHKAIENEASKDVIAVMIKRMSLDIANYQNDKGMCVLDIAAGGRGDIYDLIYEFIETPETKRRQQDFQSRKYLPNGTKVRRGRDWNDRNYDYHGDGVVTRPHPFDGGIFKVKWDGNGIEREYAFGYNNYFRLRIID